MNGLNTDEALVWTWLRQSEMFGQVAPYLDMFVKVVNIFDKAAEWIALIATFHMEQTLTQPGTGNNFGKVFRAVSHSVKLLKKFLKNHIELTLPLI